MTRITLKEIAIKAGVSIGTVDRVIHNRGHVDPEKEKKVRYICEKYGYKSNIVGKAMYMQQHEHRVAVVVNSKDTNSFSHEVYCGLQKIESEINDYNITFTYFDLIDKTETELLRILEQLEPVTWTSIIIKPIDTPAIRNKLNTYAIRGTKIISCTSDIQGVEKFCYVGQNHVGEGRLTGNTLCKIFHEKPKVIALIGQFSSAARKEKFNGFDSYMKEHISTYTLLELSEVPFSYEKTYTEMTRLLQKYPEANTIYLHPAELGASIQAIKDYQKFTGVAFTYSHRGIDRNLFLEGPLTFAIYEEPYLQGYTAGNVLFEYLVHSIVPNNKAIFLGTIAFEENC